MNNSAMRIEFDDSNIREIEDAKTIYRKARNENRIITDLDGNVIESFKSFYKGFLIKDTELSADQFSARFFDETGDRRLIWDAKDPKQIKEAKEKFDEYISKGWRAYMTDENGKKGRRIYGFDPDDYEIFFDEKSASEKLKKLKEMSSKPVIPEKTLSEKLKSFVASMKSTKVVPKTYPG